MRGRPGAVVPSRPGAGSSQRQAGEVDGHADESPQDQEVPERTQAPGGQHLPPVAPMPGNPGVERRHILVCDALLVVPPGARTEDVGGDFRGAQAGHSVTSYQFPVASSRPVHPGDSERGERRWRERSRRASRQLPAASSGDSEPPAIPSEARSMAVPRELENGGRRVSPVAACFLAGPTRP